MLGRSALHAFPLTLLVALTSSARVRAEDAATPATTPPAQPRESHDTYSVLAGGFGLERSLLLLVKGGREWGHFALSAELARDSLGITWQDGSEGDYVLWAYSLAGRGYLFPGGRGPYLELGVGNAHLALGVEQEGARRTAGTGLMPLVSWGVGVRLGQVPRGWFGELGYRSAVALRNVRLFTDETLPAEGLEKGVGYHSWVFERGTNSGQFFLGAGYSF